MRSSTRNALSYATNPDEDLYARHLHLLVHHARATGRRTEMPGAGGAARPPHRGLGHYLL